MMSGPGLPYKISSWEEALACLLKITKRVDDLLLRPYKPTSRKTVASSDLAPDPSYDLNSVMVITPGFRGPPNHDPHISRLRTQTRFFTPLIYDLEPDITKPTPRKIFASSDLAPDPSFGIDSGWVIAQGFLGPSNHRRDQTMLRNPSFKCNLRQCLSLIYLF